MEIFILVQALPLHFPLLPLLDSTLLSLDHLLFLQENGDRHLLETDGKW